MKERIKKIRKHFGLSQADFGESLGVSRDAISNYELGRVVPSELFVNHLCSTFNVNPDWLEKGEGEMLKEMSDDEEVAYFVGQMLGSDGSPSILKSFIKILSRTTPEEREVLSKIIEKTIDDYEGK